MYLQSSFNFITPKMQSKIEVRGILFYKLWYYLSCCDDSNVFQKPISLHSVFLALTNAPQSLRGCPKMTSDFRVGRGVQKSPKFWTL